MIKYGKGKNQFFFLFKVKLFMVFFFLLNFDILILGDFGIVFLILEKNSVKNFVNMIKVILQNILICFVYCVDVKKRKRRNFNLLMLGINVRLFILQVGIMFKGFCMIRVKFGFIDLIFQNMFQVY